MPYTTERELEWFQHRADEARAMADRALTPEMRQSFLGIAEEWEAMIKRAQGAAVLTSSKSSSPA
jgi:hypothetical protein